MCLSQDSHSCVNIMTKKQVGEERVYSAYTSTLLFITKGSQDRNSSRSGSRSWCRGHGGMLLTGLLPQACTDCFLIEPKTTSSGMAPPTMGWVLPPWSLTEKMLYSWVSWGHFHNGSFFSMITTAHVKLTHKTSQYMIFFKTHISKNPNWIQITCKTLRKRKGVTGFCFRWWILLVLDKLHKSHIFMLLTMWFFSHLLQEMLNNPKRMGNEAKQWALALLFKCELDKQEWWVAPLTISTCKERDAYH